MQIQYIKLDPSAVAPYRGSEEAAGYDLCALSNTETDDCNYYISSGETVKIHTGIAVSLPAGTFGAIFARSGLATKQGLRPANCVGVIDSDYRGEVIVALHNDSYSTRTIEPGERIAQLVVLPYITTDFIEVDSLDETKRGAGGFGSTGIN